jgi:DHA2 family multidrug resistance protein
LTNFVRNIGSSVGVSLVQTILARRQQFHMTRLSDHFSPSSPALASTYQTLAVHGASGAAAQGAGLALIYQELMGQAAALSYLDGYLIMGVAAAAMFFLSFLLQHNDPRHTEVHAGH